MYTAEQIQGGVTALGIEPEVMIAVAKKEINGKKLIFNYKGRDIPQILFERHQFWRELTNRNINPRDVLARNPKAADILAQTPFKSYGRFITQYARRDQAIQIHREAAFASCSYGGFQIMGYFYEVCGYRSAEEFAEAMSDPANHIPAFVAVVKHKGLQKALQNRDFVTFAEGWNGPKYYVNHYHIELARIYQREIAKSLPRHDSVIKAVVQSSTVQRGAAVVATGSLPTAGVLIESGTLSQIMDTIQQYADKGREISDQLHNLQVQAESLAPYLHWLPWAAGGWTVLLLIIFALLVRRYLLDRGYI